MSKTIRKFKEQKPKDRAFKKRKIKIIEQEAAQEFYEKLRYKGD